MFTAIKHLFELSNNFLYHLISAQLFAPPAYIYNALVVKEKVRSYKYKILKF